MSVAAAAPSADAALIGDLRRARRRRRLEDIDFFEALYRAYLLALVVGLAVVVAAGQTGDPAVGGAALAHVRQTGGAVVGALFALLSAIALRSAGRGGPLALEEADVRHLLMAPVTRRSVLTRPAVQLLRRCAFGGAVVGAIAGVAAYHRLPGNHLAWVLLGGAVAALAALGGAGAGMAAGGHRVGRWTATGIALLILGWSGADIALSTTTSPWSLLGGVALWPLHVEPVDLIGVAVILLLVPLGLWSIPGLSIESAERRSSLVGALRFAATTRDLRAVALLRRQLAQERPRNKPWIRLRPHGKRRTRRAIWHRGWQGLLRWPAQRILRLLVLGAVAGVCLRGAWSGTAPLAVVAAIALWMAALDAVEPLAQEIDHGDRLALIPRTEGWIETRHLAVPAVTMVFVCLAGVAAALAFGHVGLTAELGGTLVVPAALAAVAGAAVSVLRQPALPPGAGGSAFAQPELAGVQMILRELLPPGIAFVGVIPLLVARTSFLDGRPPFDNELNSAFFTLLVPIAAFAWVQYRGRPHPVLEEAKAMQQGSRAGRAAAAGARSTRPPARASAGSAGRAGGQPGRAGGAAGGGGATAAGRAGGTPSRAAGGAARAGGGGGRAGGGSGQRQQPGSKQRNGSGGRTQGGGNGQGSAGRGQGSGTGASGGSPGSGSPQRPAGGGRTRSQRGGPRGRGSQR